MIIVNGTAVEADGQKLTEYLEEAGFAGKRIAVELNEEILPKAQYDSCILKDGDVLEIVSFVGGG